MMISVCNAQTPSEIQYPGGKGWQPGEVKYGYTIVRDIFIPIDDDIKLEAKISYPTDKTTGIRAKETFPVLVEFTPYDSNVSERLPYTYLTEHGYIIALVHPRGSGKSTGILEQFTSQDGLDGVKVVDWAAKLNGSNGKVGFFGASYPGALALATAAKVGKNSPLKAVLAASIGLGAQYRQAWTNNGLPTILMMGYGNQARAAMGDNEGAEIYFKEFDRSFWAGEAPAYDGEYWADRLPLAWTKDIVENGIPVLQWGGWQDLNETGAIRAYVAYQNAVAGRNIYLSMEKEQKTSPRYQQIIGDWGHGIGMDIGVYLEWFDTWLKDVDTGLADTKKPLHLYEVGTGNWVNLDVYPVVEKYTAWYLGNGTISETISKDGENYITWGKPEEKEGKLTFEGSAIQDGMTISGPLSLKLYAKSDNTNIEILARLYDVAPDNSVTEITKGAMLGSMSELDENMSWRTSDNIARWPWPKLNKDEYLTPDKIQTFEMALEPIQYGLQPKHRLRLVLSTQSLGSDNKMGLIAEPAELTAPQKATLPGVRYTILFGKNTPTALYIPQLPFEDFSAVKAVHTPTSWNELTRDFDKTGYTIPVEW